MGEGIRLKDGGDPLVAWRMRIQSFGDAEVTSALRALLGGRPVTAEDGVLEIAVMPIASPNAFRVSVLRPTAPYVAELVVSAWASRAAPDPRSPLPAPDQWLSEVSETRIRWELFNCIVHRLASRAST